MKTPFFSRPSFLSSLIGTTLLLTSGQTLLAEDNNDPNNPDYTCVKKSTPPKPEGESGCGECEKSAGTCPDKPTTPETTPYLEYEVLDRYGNCPEGYEKVRVGEGGGGGRSRSARALTAKTGPWYATPASIRVYGDHLEVIRDADTWPRQIKSSQKLLDIVTLSEGIGMEIRDYRATDLKPAKVGGLYTPQDGIEPLVVTRFLWNPDSAQVETAIIDHSAEFPSEQTVSMSETAGEAPGSSLLTKTWKKGAGLSAVEYKRVTTLTTPVIGGLNKEENYLATVEEKNIADQWVVVSRKAGRRAVFKEEDGLVPLYECDAVDEKGTPLPQISTETTRTYYTDPADAASCGKIRTLRRSDGYWENKYYNANTHAGLETEKTESPWLNTAAHEPGSAPQGAIRIKTEIRCSTDNGVEDTTETVDGVLIAKEWTEKSPVGKDKVRETRHQPHAGGDKTTVTIRYRRARDIPAYLTGKTLSVRNADGSRETYTYQTDGNRLITTRDSGWGAGDAIAKGERTITVTDKNTGKLQEETRYALENGQAHWLGSRTGVVFDKAGNALKWVYDNNPDDYTEQRKDCCHVTWERGRDGIETTYTYDAAGRKTATTTRGVTTGIDYDGLTTIQWKQAAGSDPKHLVAKTLKNQAGQTIENTAPVVGGKTITTAYAYNIPERTTRTRTPYGTTRQTIKTADNQPLSETGTTGLTTHYTYAPSANHGGGLITTVTQGERLTRTVTDLLGTPLTQENARGALTRNTCDAAGRLLQTTLPDGETKLYQYEADGTTASGLDLDGDGQLNPAVDRMNRTLKTFDPTWPANKGSWKTENQLAWQGNWTTQSTQWATEDGTQTRTQTLGVEGYTKQEKPTLKDRGNTYIVKTTKPDLTVTETLYTLENGMKRSTQTCLRDGSGTLITSEAASYNSWGKMQSRTDVRMGVTRYQTDEVTGIVISVTSPDNTTVSYEYDDYGRLIVIVRPDGLRQYVSYDSEGRIIRQWGGGQYPVSYEYNAYGQKIAMITYRTPVTDSVDWPDQTTGDCTFWIYDSKDGALLHKQYTDGQRTSYTYTPGGKRKTLTNARGTVTSYAYDIAGQQVAVTVKDNGMTPLQTQAFDQWGRTVSINTEGVAAYTYIYNTEGQLIRENIALPADNGALNRSIERLYDSWGHLSAYQLKQGNHVEQSITYAYTSAGSLSCVMADGKIFTYGYTPNAPHLLAGMTSPVHIVNNSWEPTRDFLSRKTNVWKNKADISMISSYTYTVNILGQRTAVATEGEAFTSSTADWTWKYDVLGQVSQANENRYAYDRIGNRLTCGKGNEVLTSYTTNELNQYTDINTAQPTYDADGNQLTGLPSTGSLPHRPVLTFTYNANNRPTELWQNGELKELSTYDHQGRRIRKGETLTLYDGYNAIAEYNLSTRTLKTTFAWGNDLSGRPQGAGGVGGLLSVTEHDRQLPLVSYPCYDGNGNITEYLTEENAGTIAAHYEYDAFGNVLKKSGKNEYAYQFSTKPYDNFTGLNYYNYRDYEPISGRWINRDPIEEEGGLNLYGFINNKLPSGFDFLGKWTPRSEGDCCSQARNEGLHKTSPLKAPDFGGVLCCDGRKVACNWAWKEEDLLYSYQEIEDIFRDCITEHELDHFQDIDDCPCKQGITRPPYKDGMNKDSREKTQGCKEIKCFQSKIEECAKIKDDERRMDCEDSINRRIGTLKDHFSCE